MVILQTALCRQESARVCVAPPRLPHQVRKGAGSVDPAADTIKVLTMHVNKGLEFPMVALMGADHMPAPCEDECDEAKLFCVGATRATQRLLVGAGGSG